MSHVNFIISPHLDDAVFSLGGFIQTEATRTVVITVFSGAPKEPQSRFWDRRCGFANSTEAMRTRTEEDRAALSALGVAESAIIHLPYLDEQYRVGIENRISEEMLKKQIIEHIERVVKNESATIRLFAPLTKLHTDHRIVRDALLEWHARSPSFELYLYQDVPYAFITYLKERILHPFSSRSHILDRLGPRNLTFVRQTFPCTERQYQNKLAAIARYRSQFRPKLSALSLVPNAVHFLSRAESGESTRGETAYRIISPQAISQSAS